MKRRGARSHLPATHELARATPLLLAACLLATACERGVEAQPRQQATPHPTAPARPATSPNVPGHFNGPTPPAQSVNGEVGFFGIPDAPAVRSLTSAEPADIERGYGGRSVAFKITLADGTKGYFKPEQTFSAAHWYSEIAAFHLDRELGLGRVPPVVGRRFSWPLLRRAAPRDNRFSEVILEGGRDGTTRGAFVWWVPERLSSWRVGTGWERWVRVQGWPATAITPFQRARVYADQSRRRRELLQGGGDAGVAAQPAPPSEPVVANEAPAPRRARAAEPDSPERPRELSDLIVFDYLTNNLDRWGGGNANVLVRGPGGPFVFLDNAAGFTPRVERLSLMDARLHVVQRFRRTTVEAIRSLNVQRWVARMATDPLSPVLDPQMIEAFEVRRRHLLEHIAETERRFGAQIYW